MDSHAPTNPIVTISLKPKNSKSFAGTRNFLSGNTWIYEMEQCFNLALLANGIVILSDDNIISFATIVPTTTAFLACVCTFVEHHTGSKSHLRFLSRELCDEIRSSMPVHHSLKVGTCRHFYPPCYCRPCSTAELMREQSKSFLPPAAFFHFLVW